MQVYSEKSLSVGFIDLDPDSCHWSSWFLTLSWFGKQSIAIVQYLSICLRAALSYLATEILPNIACTCTSIRKIQDHMHPENINKRKQTCHLWKLLIVFNLYFIYQVKDRYNFFLPSYVDFQAKT